MSMLQDVNAEELARVFHHYQQALTQDCEREEGGKKESSSWDRASHQERKVLVAAARLAILELSTTPATTEGRPYFAKPGEADWGC